MITYTLDKYPIVLLSFTASSWHEEDIDKVFTELKEILSYAIKQKERISLLIEGVHGIDRPSVASCISIVDNIHSLKELFVDGLAKTAIYKPDATMDFFFSMLFKIYRPSRPLKFFTDQRQASTWVEA